MKNRLRELRAVRRWSQTDLADRLDVSRQTVYAIETGRYDPSLPLAFKIAALFGEPIESLFSPRKTRTPHRDHPSPRGSPGGTDDGSRPAARCRRAGPAAYAPDSRGCGLRLPARSSDTPELRASNRARR